MSGKSKTYKCLNPIGTQLPVRLYPISPRLNILDGKTIHFSICGEPDITIPLEKKLKAEYPNVNWTQKKTYGIIPIQMSDEEMKTTDAVILGVCW
jgi:hypothetical protein